MPIVASPGGRRRLGFAVRAALPKGTSRLQAHKVLLVSGFGAARGACGWTSGRRWAGTQAVIHLRGTGGCCGRPTARLPVPWLLDCFGTGCRTAKDYEHWDAGTSVRLFISFFLPSWLMFSVWSRNRLSWKGLLNVISPNCPTADSSGQPDSECPQGAPKYILIAGLAKSRGAEVTEFPSPSCRLGCRLVQARQPRAPAHTAVHGENSSGTALSAGTRRVGPGDFFPHITSVITRHSSPHGCWRSDTSHPAAAGFIKSLLETPQAHA